MNCLIVKNEIIKVEKRIKNILNNKEKFLNTFYDNYVELAKNSVYSNYVKLAEPKVKNGSYFGKVPFKVKKKPENVFQHLDKKTYELIFFKFTKYPLINLSEKLGKGYKLLDCISEEVINVPFVLVNETIYYNEKFDYDRYSDKYLFLEMLSLHFSNLMLDNFSDERMYPKKFLNVTFLLMATNGFIETKVPYKKFLYYNTKNRSRIIDNYIENSLKEKEEIFEFIGLNEKWYQVLVLLLCEGKYINSSPLIKETVEEYVDKLTDEQGSNMLLKIKTLGYEIGVHARSWELYPYKRKEKEYRYSVKKEGTDYYLGRTLRKFDEEFKNNLNGLFILESLFE